MRALSDIASSGSPPADARAANPQQARHLHRLALYDGLVAVHTQDYEAGEAILRAVNSVR